jgi:prolyl-tRNA synthetase
MAKNFTSRATDFSKWYNELVIKADLAQNSDVRGCMIIKPYGYSIWECLQQELDRKFKETGHLNAYFPLLVPKSYLSKEAKHVEGFAKECAVVTHYRLKTNESGDGVVVDSDAKLEEELIIRPTSETIIWNTFKGWIESYRDLPLLINQWANVMRWEMKTRMFLRTSEFLWQEGHTAHATEIEAVNETRTMLNVYADFLENYMAIPVIKGVKTENERFPGALDTYCVEALMQDGKALQAGTSHFLGQKFSESFDVKFSDKDGKQKYVWGTSWGVSTRLIGGLIMTHSDDEGLVLPPKLAPIQVVIIPIYKGEEQLKVISDRLAPVIRSLRSKGIRVKFDDRDTQRPGWKFAQYEFQGVPIRLALGSRDLEAGNIEVARRDEKSKEVIAFDGVVDYVEKLLEEIQDNLFKKALNHRSDYTTDVDSYDEFKKIIAEKGGFVSAHWDGTTETELRIKDETSATIRCIPLDSNELPGVCIFSGNPSKQKVLFAKAY